MDLDVNCYAVQWGAKIWDTIHVFFILLIFYSILFDWKKINY